MTEVAKPTGGQEEGQNEEETFVLTFVHGPEAKKRFVIAPETPGPVLVGKGPACPIRLTDVFVSRRHVELDIEAAGLRIRDLGSKNGTLVDGLSVVEAVLRGGETVRVGDSAFKVTAERHASPSREPERDRFGCFLGRSRAMRRLYPLLDRIAASDIPVIIEGETGTGKEVLAQAIHDLSRRAGQAFVVFDCTTMPANLMESELFGHEKGAFTGAVSARRGAFEQANRGTILIDEIGDLELPLQPKLLRLIERHEFRRLGSEHKKQVDVRIIAATRRNLDNEVQAGRFRDDLFHRLAVARVELPPLRHRCEDIDLLVHHFWHEFGGEGEPPDVMLARWRNEEWTGNVRELRNAVARYVALGGFDRVDTFGEEQTGRDWEWVRSVVTAGIALPVVRHQLVAELERRYIEEALALHEGDIRKAARAAGISPRYFNVLRSGKRRDRST